MKACFKRLTGVRTLLASVAAVAFLIVAAAPASASIQFDGQWGSFSVLPTNGTFNTPNRAATDASGNVYVTDSGNGRIQEFNSTGTYQSQFGALGSGNGQFLPLSALGIAVDSAGNSYVVDKLGSRVEKFNSSGTFVTAWGGTGTNNGQFATPSGIATDGSGNVYVVDTGNSRIQEFDSSGNFITKWGTVGAGDGQFTTPSGVAVDSTGDVYVADSGNSRIQKFDSSGNFITKWGTVGTGDGQFGPSATVPLDIAIGPSDNVVVVDATNNRVEKFRPIGTFITKWGTAGSGTSQFTLPSGVAIASGGEVYVVDQGNNRVERFQETDVTAPTTSLDSGPSGISGPDVSFTFSSPDSPLLGPGFECRFDTAEWESCGSPKAYSNLSDGSHTFRVRAVDAAGNPDPSATVRTWTVDTIPPQTTIDSGPSAITNDANPSFGFSSSEPGSTFECRLDSTQAADWQNCSSPKAYASLTDGSHTFEVRATDSLGNLDATPASRTFTLDTQAPRAPRITGTNPASPANDNHPKVKGNAPPGARVKIYKVAGCTGSPLVFGRSGRFHSTGLGVTVPDNSTTSFRATATDAAGNTSPCSPLHKYVEDSKAPSAPSIKGTMPASPANDNQPRVRGFSEAPATIRLYTAMGCTGTPAASGTAAQFHSAGLTVSVADNTTTSFRATATDQAGNTSPCSAPRSYVEDSIAPETSIVAGPGAQTTNHRPTFRFASSETGSIFRCGFDSQPFGRCSGPGASHTPYVPLSFGSHVFRVRAVDPAGNIDTTPAKRTFSVVP